jgi:hypothetical protein
MTSGSVVRNSICEMTEHYGHVQLERSAAMENKKAA